MIDRKTVQSHSGTCIGCDKTAFSVSVSGWAGCRPEPAIDAPGAESHRCHWPHPRSHDSPLPVEIPAADLPPEGLIRTALPSPVISAAAHDGQLRHATSSSVLHGCVAGTACCRPLLLFQQAGGDLSRRSDVLSPSSNRVGLPPDPHFPEPVSAVPRPRWHTSDRIASKPCWLSRNGREDHPREFRFSTRKAQLPQTAGYRMPCIRDPTFYRVTGL